MATKQSLEAYLAELHQQREQEMATLHAVDGAIQAVQTLISKETTEPVVTEAEIVEGA